MMFRELMIASLGSATSLPSRGIITDLPTETDHPTNCNEPTNQRTNKPTDGHVGLEVRGRIILI